ncbi:MAG: molybdenum cofactor guanylyltransferase [Sulfurovum sp.]|nr:molybdenum cofactor guanylyltransferase [Sulfurovum sp.]
MNSAVIFAGGKSSRMGRDKALLPVGGYASMAEYQYRKLKKCFDTVYISSKEDKFNFEVPILYDLFKESSPMVALGSIFEQLEDEVLFVLSVDMPNIDHAEIETLIQAYQNTEPKPDIIIAKSSRGMEPLCGIYRKTILPHVKKLLEEDIHKMSILLDKVYTKMILFQDDKKFLNVNTPEEYQAINP